MKGMTLGYSRSRGGSQWGAGREGYPVLPLLLVMVLLAGCGGAPATAEITPTLAEQPTATGAVATPLAPAPTATAGSATTPAAETPAAETPAAKSSPTEAPAETVTVAPSAEAPTAEATAQESPLQQHDVPPEGVKAVLTFPTYVIQCRPATALGPGDLGESQADAAAGSQARLASAQAQATPPRLRSLPGGKIVATLVAPGKITPSPTPATKLQIKPPVLATARILAPKSLATATPALLRPALPTLRVLPRITLQVVPIETPVIPATPSARPLVVAILPTRPETPMAFGFCLIGFAGDAGATVNIKAPDGSARQDTVTIHDDGAALYSWTISPGDPAGRYTITVRQGSLQAAAEFRIYAASVLPASSRAGSTLIVTLAGFEAGEQVQLHIYHENNWVNSVTTGTDAGGRARYPLVTAPGDRAGRYMILTSAPYPVVAWFTLTP